VNNKCAEALQAALALARDGLACFPAFPSKCPSTPHGFYDASKDPAALRALWQQFPGPLVGVRTGAVSGIAVLDLDRKHREATDWWIQNRPRLPSTRVHRTRSGGLHLIFCHADGVRCTTGRIAAGIDTRGDGGYVIWWPAAGLPVLSGRIASRLAGLVARAAATATAATAVPGHPRRSAITTAVSLRKHRAGGGSVTVAPTGPPAASPR
jgi:hypothetical protein